ncbi:MAG: hypothetical protein V9E88_17140 [Ferruginibacter sp.]
MKRFFLAVFLLLSVPVVLLAQQPAVQNASIPKDAQVDVTVKDFKDNVLNNEVVIFKSKVNTQGIPGFDQ